MRVEGVGVVSGVAEQPVGFDEIIRGASNRARAAVESQACELAVGIEDGLIDLPEAAAGSPSSVSEFKVHHVNIGLRGGDRRETTLIRVLVGLCVPAGLLAAGGP